HDTPYRRPGGVGAIVERENRSAQNPLAAVSTMKPGMLRRLALRIVFWSIGVSSRYYRPGTLQGIGTIHFARWILVPGTNKLLFFSNYCGSWESYREALHWKSHEAWS